MPDGGALMLAAIGRIHLKNARCQSGPIMLFIK